MCIIKESFEKLFSKIEGFGDRAQQVELLNRYDCFMRSLGEGYAQVLTTSKN